MIIGRYMLDLYCDGIHEELGDVEAPELPASIIGTDFADCRRKAIRSGWKLSEDGKRCLCPECAGSKCTKVQ